MQRFMAVFLGLVLLVFLSPVSVPRVSAQSSQYIEIVFDISGSMDDLVYPQADTGKPTSFVAPEEAQAADKTVPIAPMAPIPAPKFVAPKIILPPPPIIPSLPGNIDLQVKNVKDASLPNVIAQPKDPNAPKSRIEIARQSLRQTLGQVSGNVSLGFRVFGKYCNYSELLVPFDQNNQQTITDIADKLVPAGDTPLAYAISQARADLADKQGTKKIIIITDGEESCGGDVLAEAKALVAGSVSADLIFFGSDQLSDIMKQFVQITQGHSVNAVNQEQLTIALQQAFQAPVVTWWWIWIVVVIIFFFVIFFWYRRKEKKSAPKRKKKKS